MHSKLSALVWIFFSAIFYLIAAEALAPWLRLPQLGNIGFTAVFVLFAVLHCARCQGWKCTGLFFVTAAVVSYLLEETGVRTGLIYGHYHYSNMLGPMLGDVPVLIPLAWFMMIYPSWITARALMRGLDTRSFAGIGALALIAAMVMTAWDVVMDPGMSAAGNWVWEQGGAYFGVPLWNYFGWLLTTFLIYYAAGLIWRSADAAAATDTTQSPASAITKTFAALPIVVYAVHGVRYVTAGRIQALHVVALFAMVLPALLAMMQTWMARAESRA